MRERPDYTVTLYPSELEAAGHDRTTAEEAHADAMARGAKCLQCPLFGLKAGPVPSEIKAGAPLLVCGEAPGPQEVDFQRPFIGQTGVMTEDAIWEGGLTRAQTSYTNAISCRPPEEYGAYTHRVRIEYEKRVKQAEEDGVPPPPEPLMPDDACRARLAHDIATAQPNTVLALGVQAVKGVAEHYDVPYGSRGRKARVGEAKISSLKRVLGAPVCPPGKPVIVATYHPAFATRKGNRHYAHIVRGHIAKAARIATRGGVLAWVPAKTINIDPTLEQVLDMYERFKRSGLPVYVDAETDSAIARTATIRCIGYAQRVGSDWEVMVVPWHTRAGDPLWGPEDLARLRSATRGFHDTVDMRGHNFVMFDSLLFIANGLLERRPRPLHDTMLKHRNTIDNDAPHGLGFVVSSYTEAPAHKDDANDKFLEGEASDADIRRYCGSDVHTTGVVDECLDEEIDACRTRKAYETDWRTAPIYRDEGDLGMCIDMQAHRELWLKFETLRRERKQALRGILGNDKFNPNAPDQIRDFLFRKKGLIPCISTRKGKAWAPGDDPATNVNGLTELTLKRHLDDQTKKFIDALMRYRAVDKIVGTYLYGLVKDRTPKSELDDEQVVAIRGAPNPETDLERFIDWTYARIGPRSNTTIVREVIDGEMYFMLHPQYKMHIPTGRVATSPSIQNWPAVGLLNMRRLGISPAGHMFVGADYEQIELRLYAVRAGDEIVLDAFRRDLDVHTLNYAACRARNPRDMDEVFRIYHETMALKKRGDEGDEKAKKTVKAWRTLAKRFVYLILYGGEAGKLYATMSTDRDKATGKLLFEDLTEALVERMYNNWHESHPWTRTWQLSRVEMAEREGSVVTILDERRRHFPGGLNKRNAAPNAEIQGSAAAVNNLGVERLAAAIPHRSWSRWTGLNLQIHDYNGAYVPVEHVERAKQIFNECMPFEFEGMPFPAVPGVSYSWADQ